MLNNLRIKDSSSVRALFCHFHHSSFVSGLSVPLWCSNNDNCKIFENRYRCVILQKMLGTLYQHTKKYEALNLSIGNSVILVAQIHNEVSFSFRLLYCPVHFKYPELCRSLESNNNSNSRVLHVQRDKLKGTTGEKYYANG